MQVFVEVVDRGNLTAAGKALDMSRAMVSRHLASLENWLEVRLLHRTTRSLSLTDAGEEALTRCRQLLELANEVQATAGSRRVRPSGRIRIASSSSFASTCLAPALATFLDDHPDVSIELSTHEHPVDLVAERIDLAVRIGNRLDPSLVARRLCDCRSVLCASPDYLRTRGTPRDIEALAGHVFATHAHVATDAYRLVRGERVERVVPTSAFRTNDPFVMRRLVLADHAIAMLPSYLVVDDLVAGRMTRVLPAYEPEVLGIHAVYLSRRHPPLLLRAVIDHLAERFGGGRPAWDEILENADRS